MAWMERARSFLFGFVRRQPLILHATHKTSSTDSSGMATALGWSAVSTALRIALGFVSAKVSAIYLGPSGIALVGNISNFIQLSTGVILSGTNDALLNLTAKRERDELAMSRLWSTAITVVIGVGSFVTIATIMAAPRVSQLLLLDRRYWPAVMIAAIAMPIAAIDILLLSALNGLRKVNIVAGAGIVSTIVDVVIFSSSAYLFGLWGALCAVSATYAGRLTVSLAMTLWSNAIRPRALLRGFDFSTFREVMTFYPMFIVNVIAVPVSQILVRNKIVASSGLDAAGQLQAVWRLSDIYVGVLTTALSMFFMARFSSLDSPTRRAQFLVTTLSQLFLLTACAAVGIYLLRDVIISVVLTEQFRPIRYLLPFQLAGDVIRVVDIPLQMSLVSSRRTKVYIAQAVTGPITYVVLTFVLQPLLDLQSATVAHCVAYAARLLILGVAAWPMIAAAFQERTKHIPSSR